ncbi:MAG: 3-(cis-5,6-dihydroxycyclohexa-1,3-dien-1-yl)propanoate dehydrogenase [Nitriliruptorales bacterium]|nr:3-(cis-5,6-dihydroxycyclohexa-1,3-dien-1-yl)propanoate dehydrogenase [Nitriliruptorales bacterium]
MGMLDGKVALLVGGGAGIGRAVVDAFRDEGARVMVLDVDETKCKALSGLGEDLRAVPGDATSLADNRRAVEAALEAFGRLDVLATFVGVFDYYTHLVDLPDDAIEAAFDEIFRTNVLSCLLSVKAAAEPLRERGGSIVLTLSTSSFYPGRGGVLYVATKFAGRGLVTELAHELAPSIRVNGVAPGGTLGTELRGLRALGMQGRTLGTTPGRAEELASRTPLRIALDGSGHAGAYVFLASDRSRGTTGTIVHSDGGIGVRG